MSSIDSLAKDLYTIIHNKEEKGPKPYEPVAKVVKVDDDTIWVKIPGGETETPVEKTIDAEIGDRVRVRVSGGRAWILGNATSPPASSEATVRYIQDGLEYNPSFAENFSNSIVQNSTIVNSAVENAIIQNSEMVESRIYNSDIENFTVINGVVQDLEATDAIIQGHLEAHDAEFESLDTNYAHITNGVIDNATIGYADIDDLNAHYAEIDLANVNNAWIEYGAMKKAEVFDENVFDLSGDHATISKIDASRINVANLNADNLIVRRINGQPVVGGYTLISPSSAGYSSKNPRALGWYEFVNAQWVLSQDTTVDMTKAYYQTGNEVSLYDQAYINNLNHELNQRIDGAVESFTGTVVPTLTNWPYTDWYDTSVTPVHDERANHVGDIYYVVNAASEQDGYAYRFAFDNTTNAYDWVLIRDTDITKALSDISELQTFESNTTSWMEETDEGLVTIRQNYTTLSGTVDKTVKESIQLWFTKANTTAPNKPNSATYPNGVTDTSTAGNGWRVVVPAWNVSYPNYFYCWQYKFVDGTFGWSNVVRDIAMGETQGMSRDAKNTADNALPASTFETFESTTFTELVDEVDEQSTTMTNMTTRLGLNADGTGANTDIVAKESALEQTVDGISTRVGKTETKLIGMYATSSTAANTRAKVATIVPTLPNDAVWELTSGTMVTVKFVNANTYAATATYPLTLNVNSKGAKPIKTYSNGDLSEAEYKWAAGSTFTFVYNGTNWLMQDSTQSVRMNSNETKINQTATSIESLASNQTTYTKPDGTTGTNAIKSAITQTANSIESVVANNTTYTAPDGTTKTNTIQSAIQHNAENISLRVEKSGVIAAINLSTETSGGSTAKISADKVNIEGATIFTSGRLSETSLDNTYDALGAAADVEAQIPTDISELNDSEGLIPTDISDLNDSQHLIPDISGKADKTDAIAEEQLIYIQATSGTNSVPAYPSSATTTSSYWVTQSGESIPNGTPPNSATGQTPRWTIKRPSYQKNYPVLFVAKQKRTVSGTITCTTPIKDDTTTIIDGGHITTGTIDASQVTVNNIDATKITVNKIQASQIETNTITVSSLSDGASYSTTQQMNQAISDSIPRVTYNGVMNTGNGTYAKVATCKNFALATGAIVSLYMGSSEVNAAALTLNVNSTGAKDIYVAGTKVSSTNRLNWLYGCTINFVYDGTGYVVTDNPPSYSGETCSIAEGTAQKDTVINQAVLFKGTTVTVPMTNSNTASTPTLRIKNSSGTAITASNIYFGSSSTSPTKANGYAWPAGVAVIFTFDGQYWRFGNQTFIDGGNILTGTINAERLNIADTITAINNNTTTTINGGKITTGTIGANQIAAHSIGASHLTIGDNTNLATANELYEASLPTDISTSYLPIISDGYLTKKTTSQQYLMVTDYVTNRFKTGDELYYEFYGKAATAGSVNIGAFGYTGTPPTHTYSHQQITPINLTTTETFYSGTLSLSNANWNTATQYLLGFQDSRSTKSQIYIKKLIIRKISSWHDNLLIDSQKMSAWRLASSLAVRDVTGEFGVVTLTGTSEDWSSNVDTRPTIRASILDGTPLWLSFEYKASAALTTSILLSGTANADGSPTTGTRTKYSPNNLTSLPAASSWTRKIVAMPTSLSALTYGSGDVNSLYIQFYNRTSSGATWDIRKVKLERFSATDWTPSPEDQKAYVTRIDDNGIRIHPSSTENNSVVINSDGMEIFKGGTTSTYSVAQYGDTARVGKDTSRNVYIDSDSVNIRNGQTVLSKFTAEGAELGKNSDTATVKMCDGALEIKGSYRTSSSSNDTYIATISNNKTSTLKELMLKNGLVDATLFDGGQTFGRSFSMTAMGGPTVEVMGSSTGDFGVASLQAGEAYLDVRSGSDGDDGSITVPHVLINGRLSVPNNRIQNMYAYNNTVSYATNMYIGTTGMLCRTTNTSSERYKHDIKDIEDKSLDPHKLYDIEVKQFKYNEDVLTDEEDPRYGANLIGFISEQVKECYPIAVDVNEEGECEAWNHQYLIPPMLKLIQEQHEQIDSLTKRIEALERNNK